jgi:hypothetical protein
MINEVMMSKSYDITTHPRFHRGFARAQTMLILTSKETLKLIKKRGYFFVMSLPRTWKFADDRALSDLVKHLPRSRYRKTWITRSDGRRRVYWVYRKHACLRHVGDVTIVLSKQRRNDGPSATLIIVTNLPHVTSRDVVALSTRRWTVELFIKEAKGVVGLGHAQVTKDPKRIERSVALSLMAYLLLIKCRAKAIPEHGPWSAFALKRDFAWEVAHQQLEHSFSLRLRKHRKRGGQPNEPWKPVEFKDVCLDLQAVFTAAYGLPGYDLIVDYTQPPDVPLSDTAAVWVERHLRSTGLRH